MHQYGSGFVCGECGRTYKLKSSLRNHQKWECGKEPRFKCKLCDYKAKQKMHMLRHMQRVHRNEMKNTANGCFLEGNSREKGAKVLKVSEMLKDVTSSDRTGSQTTKSGNKVKNVT